MNRWATTCIQCGADKGKRRHLLTHRCGACAGPWQAAMTAANAAVRRARATGALVSPKTLTCVDCGDQAHDYDHRDYLRPMDVQPVCRACNQKRGPAIWHGGDHQPPLPIRTAKAA